LGLSTERTNEEKKPAIALVKKAYFTLHCLILQCLFLKRFLFMLQKA